MASRTKDTATQPLNEVNNNVMPATCLACAKVHITGYCPLKFAGVEHCPLCGLAHYGHFRTCPHLSSLSSCRRMLDALKQSTEPADEKRRAKQYLVGIIGDLNRRKRRDEQSAGGAGDGPAQISPATHGLPGQAPSVGLMHQVVNGGVQGLPSGVSGGVQGLPSGVNGGVQGLPSGVNGGVQGFPSQQHPTNQASSRSLVQEGVNGHQGVANQPFAPGNPTYPSPYRHPLANSNGQFHDYPPNTSTRGE